MSNDEWETPPWLFDKLNAEFHFELDVCASMDNHKLPRWIGKTENGLLAPWWAVNWCNPPYSDQTPWVEKAYEESKQGNTTVLLMICDTSTKVFRYCAQYALEIRLLDRRVKFVGATGSPRFASMIVVFGPKAQHNYCRPDGALIQSWHIQKD